MLPVKTSYRNGNMRQKISITLWRQVGTWSIADDGTITCAGNEWEQYDLGRHPNAYIKFARTDFDRPDDAIAFLGKFGPIGVEQKFAPAKMHSPAQASFAYESNLTQYKVESNYMNRLIEDWNLLLAGKATPGKFVDLVEGPLSNKVEANFRVRPVVRNAERLQMEPTLETDDLLSALYFQFILSIQRSEQMRQCGYCGEDFPPARSNQFYCCENHRKYAGMKRRRKST